MGYSSTGEEGSLVPEHNGLYSLEQNLESAIWTPLQFLSSYLFLNIVQEGLSQHSLETPLTVEAEKN